MPQLLQISDNHIPIISTETKFRTFVNNKAFKKYIFLKSYFEIQELSLNLNLKNRDLK